VAQSQSNLEGNPMLQSTYGSKSVTIARPTGFALLSDLFHATPFYLFVTGVKAVLAAQRR